VCSLSEATCTRISHYYPMKISFCFVSVLYSLSFLGHYLSRVSPSCLGCCRTAQRFNFQEQPGILQGSLLKYSIILLHYFYCIVAFLLFFLHAVIPFSTSGLFRDEEYPSARYVRRDRRGVRGVRSLQYSQSSLY
jgi:hypothetical protein